ncbi:MAG: metallophosphoesterase family protein [Spirochaetes bacterium]|jgi:predicted phosphodiesterase|nr:metallophosphoesterase family protein [Spirochaetota bacterium]
MHRFFSEIDNTFKHALHLPLNKEKYIIFSDFHLGKRKSRDDFLKNSEFMMKVLTEYYYPRGYILVLNGDVEELQKNSIDTVLKRWKDLYAVFTLFAEDNRLFKIVGNHDYRLYTRNFTDSVNSRLYDGLVLDYQGNSIFIFHGHQASRYSGHLNKMIGIILRYLAKPLGIKNIVRDYGNIKVHKTEERVYLYSQKKGLVSIIGHTHRPLFESFSDIDIILFTIERLLRDYLGAGKRERLRLEHEISDNRKHLRRILAYDSMEGAIGSIYNQEMIIPVIFNSGCVIGPKGATGIEIENDSIALVRWYSTSQKEKYYSQVNDQIFNFSKSSVYRKVLKQDSLEYIFTRIRLLTK